MNQKQIVIGMLAMSVIAASTAFAAPAKPSTMQITLDGKLVGLSGYEIADNNYFKLRDMGEALQFDVEFDADSRTVILQSKRELDMETVPQEEMDFILVPDKKPDVGESGTPVPEEQTEESDVEAVLALMNDAREKEGAAALKLDEDLCKAAQIRAEEIAELFSHTRPDGTSCFTVLKEIGWSSYGMVGENIAMGQRTPESVMDSWMNSQGHRENILNEAFTAVGIARYQNGWVQLFVG